jgi:hypothetical protein
MRTRGLTGHLSLVLMLLPIVAAAQTPTPPAIAPASGPATPWLKEIEFSGFVDGYYGYNFNRPSTGLAQVRNFDVQHDAFSLNLVEIAIEKKPLAESRGGFRIDLDYGRQAQMVNASDPAGSTLENVGQAYVSYLAPNGLQLDFGKFYSPVGYEGIKTKDNWNYSRSLVYALAEPYYHAGLRANYTVNHRVAVAGFLVNGWNNVVDNNTGKTIGGQITLKPSSALTLVETYMGGPEQAGDNAHWRHISDSILTCSASPAVTLAANYDYGRDTVAGHPVTWQGVATYVRYQPAAWFAITPRAEYYDDPDGTTTGVAQKIKGLTLTTEFKDASGVSTRIEYRRDMSDHAFFHQNTSGAVRHQDTLTVSVLYAFSSK